MAARKKFFVSRMGDICLLAVLAITFHSYSAWDFSALVYGISDNQRTTVAVLLAGAALLKSAQVPFHTWLPDTMETPTPVSALMHAGIVNAGGILMLRVGPLIASSPWASVMLVVCGMCTVLFAAVVMLTQASLKGRLAFSTVAQMGFMTVECGLGAFPLALIHLCGHSLYKAYAFLASGTVVSRTKTRQNARPFWMLALACGACVLVLPEHPLLACVAGWTIVQFPLTPAVGIAAAYCVLQIAAGWVVRPVHGLGESAGILALPAFVGLAVFETKIADWRAQPWAVALYVHARNQFYLNTLANRWGQRVWPV